jgi:hypothetical protein
MELIWSSIVMGKVTAFRGAQYGYLKDSMTAVLSCVVTFLCEYAKRSAASFIFVGFVHIQLLNFTNFIKYFDLGCEY